MRTEKQKQFERELIALLNRYNMECGSDTPDFVLAAVMLRALEAFNDGVRARCTWFGSSGTAVLATTPNAEQNSGKETKCTHPGGNSKE